MMKKLFAPTKYVNSIFDIDMNRLKSEGIKVLAIDIDNTLVPTSQPSPTNAVLSWVEKVKNLGFEIILVSNNSKKRVDSFNKVLGLRSFHRAYKPFIFSFRRIARIHNVKKDEICMIGDQLFTDILGANFAGIKSILVMPLSTDEGAGIKLKRLIEGLVIKNSNIDIYCLIGNPVSHSKSPLLHSIVYDFYGVNALYMLCLAEKNNLAHIVSQFKRRGVKGFNITVPFKQDIIRYLDVITESANKIGSVNTVKIENKKCIGYNTDGDGFVMQLKSNETVIENKRVKIIGSGGSTPAIVYALVRNGAGLITIYNRTLEKAKTIAEKYENVTARALEEFSPADCDILINTTSVGLSPGFDNSPVSSLDGISPSTQVYDIIYSPPQTKLMKMARQKGCKAYNGYKLLIYQGLLANEIWLGRKIADDSLVQRIISEMSGE